MTAVPDSDRELLDPSRLRGGRVSLLDALRRRRERKDLADEMSVIAALNGPMPNAWRHVYPGLLKATGLRSGRLYTALWRLEENGVVEATFQPSRNGKPPRRAYRLTAGHRRSLT